MNIGIDVSKDTLDVAFGTQDPVIQRFANDENGIQTLIARLTAVKPERVILEATGGLEQPFVVLAAEARLPAIVLNPAWVRDFIKSLGRAAKTDKLDARMLALYGERIQPALRELPDADQRLLEAMVARRRQLVALKTSEENRRKSAHLRLQPGIRRMIASIQEQIEQLDKEMSDHIKASPIYREAETLLRTAPGVGVVTARVMLGALPELGKLKRQQIASLVGVAPQTRESGDWKWRSFIQGGRANVRATLYMATMTAVTRAAPNPLTAFYNRLREQGKPAKVALVACMRKLLTALNAMMRDGTAFNPDMLDARPA